MIRHRSRATAADHPAGLCRLRTADTVAGTATTRHVRRWAVLAAAALSLAGVAASSGPAQAAKPTRIVLPPKNDSFVVPAGLGCAFDVQVRRDDPEAHVTTTIFDDGRVMTQGHATPTLVNLDSGLSLDHDSNYRSVLTLDPDSPVAHVVINGTFYISVWPGDDGPFGVVVEPGAMFSLTGHVTFDIELPSEVITSFTLNGTATDLCAPLSS